ncbi:MAG: ABC transporter permease [Planctomycetaceae bacterium]|nr:ABC transporter permease [Planctomycetaceae bacterium]
MSLFRIALRSITQRPVASLLTMISMGLGVMLVVAVLSIHGVVEQSFANNASLGYNVAIGAKGGKEQLVLNTVYYLSQPVENIWYSYYCEFLPQAERDRLLKESFAYRSHEAAWQTAELAALAGDQGLAGAALSQSLAAVGLPLAPDARRQATDGPAVELGRHGKYGQLTEMAIPLCLGDYFGRFRVVGTTPKLFDDLVYDIENNRKFEFAQGRNFVHHSPEHGYFEAVVGAKVARELDVKLGDEISPRHGAPEGHTHERKFTVVGILKTSGTPNDRAVFVNMEGFYLMEDHAKPLDQQRPGDQPEEAAPQSDEEARKDLEARRKKELELLRAADPEPLPVEQREVTAILVNADPMIAPGLENAINEGRDAQLVLPIKVIYELFEFIVKPVQWTLLALTAMICVVSGISILVSIYNSMSERRHEIAVMRALGADRYTVGWIILLESTLLALGGGMLGWLAGHTLCLAASPIIEDQTGVTIGFWNWEPAISLGTLLGTSSGRLATLSLPLELLLVPALLVLAIVVGFWPAVSAYRTDVAKSLGK